MGNKQQKHKSTFAQANSEGTSKGSNVAKKPNPNIKSDESGSHSRVKKHDSFLRSFICLKRKMKTSETSQFNNGKSKTLVPKRSTTDPDLLLICGDAACVSNDDDLVDLTIIEEYNRQFYEEISNRLNSLATLDEKSENSNSKNPDNFNNESYDEDPAKMLPKLQNIQRNFSILTKSPALHNINIYTNIDENNNITGKTQLKDLLNEQQVNESDYIDLTSGNQELENYSCSESNQLQSESSKSSVSLSSVSSISTLKYSLQVKSQAIDELDRKSISEKKSSPMLAPNHDINKKYKNIPNRNALERDSIGYIDETFSSSRNSSFKNKRYLESGKMPNSNQHEDLISDTYSAIPWFMFYNEVTRRLVQHRQKKQKLKTSKKHQCQRRLSVETLQNFFYDKSIIERIINKENSYDFNDNSNSEIQLELIESNTISDPNALQETLTTSFDYNLELRKARASLASSEHLTPLTRSNDYLNKLEFLNSKKKFINNDEIVI